MAKPVDPLLLNAVCDHVAVGSSVKDACKEVGISHVTFFKALAESDAGEKHLDLTNRYTRAKKCRADARFERIDEIIRKTGLRRDNPEYLEPNAARVIIDAIKWQAGKENQGRYGDKLAVDLGGSKPGLNRSDALAALQSGSITVEEILGEWTKPAERIEAETEPESVEMPQTSVETDFIDID